MLQEKNGIFYITFDIFKALPNVTAAVSARKGGASGAPFASLNMSFSSGDNPRHVLENRRRYLSALRVVPEHIICCNQVHGVNVVQAGRADRGRGALERESAIPSCDGLMTDEAGVPLTMNFADCTPLLFCDPVHHAVAVSHGGWRGTAGNIAAETLRRMGEAYGTKPDDVLAAIGPAIGPCCFEVGQEVVDAFAKLFSPLEMEELTGRQGINTISICRRRIGCFCCAPAFGRNIWKTQAFAPIAATTSFSRTEKQQGRRTDGPPYGGYHVERRRLSREGYSHHCRTRYSA